MRLDVLVLVLFIVLNIAIVVGEFIFIRNCIAKRNFKIWVGIIPMALAFIITLMFSDMFSKITPFHIVILIASALFALIYNFVKVRFWTAILAFVVQVHLAITFFVFFLIILFACVSGAKLSIDAADAQKREKEFIEEQRRLGRRV